jgi:hypothetical protein
MKGVWDYQDSRLQEDALVLELALESTNPKNFHGPGAPPIEQPYLVLLGIRDNLGNMTPQKNYELFQGQQPFCVISPALNFGRFLGRVAIGRFEYYLDRNMLKSGMNPVVKKFRLGAKRRVAA